jgi:hypothetical protein
MAKRDMSNVDTETLATGRGDKNLAYVNMANVDTYYLAETNIHDGKNLAYADMSNVSLSDFNQYGFEELKNKVTSEILPADTFDNAQYPALPAIKNYIDSRDVEKANVSMNNVDTAVLGTDSGHEGKNLVYVDFTNLAGMELVDITASEDKPWRLNPEDEIPTLDEELTEKMTHSLTTQKQLWEFVSTSAENLTVSVLKPLGSVESDGSILLSTYCSDYRVENSATIVAFSLDISEIQDKFERLLPDGTTALAMGSFNIYIPASADVSTATWPANFVWLDGNSAPPLPTGQQYLISFYTYDGGSTWMGVAKGWSTARWD